jgi:hypothetical protein
MHATSLIELLCTQILIAKEIFDVELTKVDMKRKIYFLLQAIISQT